MPSLLLIFNPYRPTMSWSKFGRDRRRAKQARVSVEGLWSAAAGSQNQRELSPKLNERLSKLPREIAERVQPEAR
jgi:hypothetical protein